MSTILGRFSEYLNLKLGSSNSKDIEEAIEIYLNQGGILKIDREGSGKPDLIYPGKKRIKKQINQAKKKEEYLREELTKLRRKKREKDRDKLNPVKKSLNPLYWRHLYKKRTDDDYKEAYKEIQPPMEKVNDSEWKDMLKMFVNEPEYRERLLEASNSQIAEGRGTIQEQVMEREQFSKDLVDKRMKKLRKKLNKYRKKRKALKKLLKIAKK